MIRSEETDDTAARRRSDVEEPWHPLTSGEARAIREVATFNTSSRALYKKFRRVIGFAAFSMLGGYMMNSWEDAGIYHDVGGVLLMVGCLAAMGPATVYCVFSSGTGERLPDDRPVNVGALAALADMLSVECRRQIIHFRDERRDSVVRIMDLKRVLEVDASVMQKELERGIAAAQNRTFNLH